MKWSEFFLLLDDEWFGINSTGLVFCSLHGLALGLGDMTGMLPLRWPHIGRL